MQLFVCYYYCVWLLTSDDDSYSFDHLEVADPGDGGWKAHWLLMEAQEEPGNIPICWEAGGRLLELQEGWGYHCCCWWRPVLEVPLTLTYCGGVVVEYAVCSNDDVCVLNDQCIIILLLMLKSYYWIIIGQWQWWSREWGIDSNSD